MATKLKNPIKMRRMFCYPKHWYSPAAGEAAWGKMVTLEHEFKYYPEPFKRFKSMDDALRIFSKRLERTRPKGEPTVLARRTFGLGFGDWLKHKKIQHFIRLYVDGVWVTEKDAGPEHWAAAQSAPPFNEGAQVWDFGHGIWTPPSKEVECSHCDGRGMVSA